MFALFGWLPPARTPGHKVIYNTTAGDLQWTELLRTRLVDEFAYTGRVKDPWKPYRETGRRAGGAAGTRLVVDFNTANEHLIENLRGEQCALFLEQDFYNKKVWVN